MITPTYVSPRPRTRILNVPADPGPQEHLKTVADGGPDRTETDGRSAIGDKTARKKREPNSGSYKTGQSGNLNGRPIEARGALAIARRALLEKVDVQTRKGPKKITKYEALIHKEISLAADGDFRARKNIIDVAKWCLGDVADAPDSKIYALARVDDTGKAILEWYANEVKAMHRTEEGSDGNPLA